MKSMLSDPDLLIALTEQHGSSVPVMIAEGQVVQREMLFAEVLDWRRSSFGQSLRDARVAVEVEDDWSGVIALLRLAGWCEAMLLIPRELKVTCKEQLIESARIESKYVCHADQSSIESLFAETSERMGSDLGESQDTEWLVPTSGTTGTPKICTHRLSALSRSTKQNQQIGQQLVWGLLYDPFRFAGIQVVLQALLGGSAIVLVNQRDDLANVIDQFVQSNVNAISATPTLFRKLLTFPNADRLSLKQLTLGGEVADQSILTALHKRYPKAKLVHIYASTEAGVGFSVADREAGFPADYVDVGTPTGCKLMVDKSSELLIRVSASDDWISTGDCVKQVGDRYFFLGRKNGSINVGGNKVMPEQVESVIRQVDGVTDVKVMGRANSITGQIVQAMVVPTVTEAIERQALKQHILQDCRQSLEPYQVPGMIQFCD